jgi:PIN domain nuclease of toxin-antitoxin system
VKILLDTHTFLWWIADDQRLSARAREIIEDGNNELFLSGATGWEITIKVQIGRLKLPVEPVQFILEQMRINAIQSLAIQMNHALHVYTLPQHHRDPFDRLLVAQSQLEGLPILSADSQLASYRVQLIW